MLDRISDLTPLGRSIKCELYAGRLGGEDVVAKVLAHSDPVWRWYFEQEVRVLPALEAIGAPRLIDVDLDGGILVIARLVGTPLARRRQVAGPTDPAVIDATLAIADRAASLDLARLTIEPAAEVRAAMRRRLLEDPSAPLGWFTEGVDRCAALGIVGADHAAIMTAAIAAAGAVCQHGDLLPRNILVDDAGAVSLIDWECAGGHARDWDRALLWANLDGGGRGRIEASIGADPARNRSFRALCAFALAREVKFARPGTRGRSRRERDLAAALARL